MPRWTCPRRVGRAKPAALMELSATMTQSPEWTTTDPEVVPLASTSAMPPLLARRVQLVFGTQPLTTMATTDLPEHKVLESPNSRTILINDWEITASTNPISNAFELDQMHAQLNVPLPEMTFGNNYLTLQHLPSTWAYIFTAEHALRAVKKGELEEGDGGVKVGYADAWLKSRCVSRSDRPRTSATFMPRPGTAWIPRR